MHAGDIDKQVQEKVLAAISELAELEKETVSRDTPLLGGESAFDSMKLVELCLALEDYAGEIGFEFDWTSESAMSKSKSMFRTAGSLVDEFLAQRRA